MKNLILLLPVVCLFFACNKTQQVTIDTQNVPDAVIKAISNNFTDISDLAFTTLKVNELYGADFKSSKNPYTAVIESNGNIKEFTIQGKLLTLPPSIIAFINATYPNATIDKSFQTYNNQKVHNGYGVQITTTASLRLELTFDLVGALLSTIQLPAVSVISKYAIANFADLPENIRNYLTNHHAGMVFYSAAGVVISNVTTYYVTVKLGDVLHNYSFSANAVVLTYTTSSLINIKGGGSSSTSSQTSITNVAAMPPVVVTYLNTNFVGWQFLKGLKQYENNVLVSYLIVAQVGPDLYYISFNANGGFIGAKKG